MVLSVDDTVTGRAANKSTKITLHIVATKPIGHKTLNMENIEVMCAKMEYIPE